MKKATAGFLISFVAPLSIIILSCTSFSSNQLPAQVQETEEEIDIAEDSVAPISTIYDIQKKVIADKAVVSTAHPLATQVGLDIIKEGGNAVDAAIAVQFALAVVYPRAGNIGGGGFMVYRSGDGSEVSTLDFREKAPSVAHRDMYLDEHGNVIRGKSQKGHSAAGVPGTVEGCFQMFQKYSKLKDWKRLIQPAIHLARSGFAVTTMEANRLNKNKLLFLQNNTMPVVFVKPDTNIHWQTGDFLIQTELAHTLELIRDNGVAGFYEGETADKIVDEMKRGGGLISLEDLKNYHSAWRKPMLGSYRGYEIITMPLPSSGGIGLIQLLGIVEKYPLDTYPFHGVNATHLMVEAERRVYADRAKFLGDVDFYPVAVNQLVDKTYIDNRFKDFDPLKATPSNKISHGTVSSAEVSEQTTHISIVDTEGGAISLTTTLNDNYGCRTVVGGAGFILNNEMDDFSSKPGVPNLYGAIGGEANSIQANKRPLSSMTPTIVTKDRKLFMVVGTPGGTTIITSVFQCITNVIDFKMSMKQSVHSRRFHSQWSPDILYIERFGFKPDVLKKLSKMGHKIKERENIGAVEAVLVLKNGQYEGVADNRSDDTVLGF
jgi:gamma-glutamyltranspeptidase / glutathione hydrolase